MPKKIPTSQVLAKWKGRTLIVCDDRGFYYNRWTPEGRRPYSDKPEIKFDATEGINIHIGTATAEGSPMQLTFAEWDELCAMIQEYREEVVGSS